MLKTQIKKLFQKLLLIKYCSWFIVLIGFIYREKTQKERGEPPPQSNQLKYITNEPKQN
jgi:hypothetical protein